MRHATAVRARDPAERWEVRFTEAEGGSFFLDGRPSHPFTPRHAEDVPQGALEALEDVCGVRNLSQVFIIPWAVRSIGWLGQKVISPNSVMALGDRAVGLWTEKPEPGLKIAIPLENIAAVEDVTILLYGRLSFVPFGDRLTIRYNTVARRGMEPALLEIRKRLAGQAQSLPAFEQKTGELPFKWKVLLEEPLVRLEKDSPVIFSSASVRGRSRREAERRQLLVMNPYELVYLCDPVDSTQRYGVDSVVVPRCRMTGVSEESDKLHVASNGAHIELSMAPSLRAAAVQWMG